MRSVLQDQMKNGLTISEEINVADAHPAGKRPFTRKEYINKFKILTDGIISKKESDRFLKCVQNLSKLNAKDLIEAISSVNESLVKDIKVFDVYEGENIPENQKSIAINVTIQSSERTLNEDDLEKINNLIIKTVENKTGAKIRS